MGVESPPPANGGVVRWDQLTASESRLRSEWKGDIAQVVANRDKQVDALSRRIDGEQAARHALEARTDKLEQWRDRWLGPAIVFLAVLQVAALVVSMYAVLR